jgi:sensor histidine kinase YesM
MVQYPFIFSAEKKYRIWRHVAFWGFWSLFQGFLYAFIPLPLPFGYLRRLPNTMADSFLFLPSHMFLSYTLMYFVIPVYVVKSRYLISALWAFILIIATGTIAAITSSYLLEPIKHAILPTKFLFPFKFTSQNSFYLSLLAGLRGGLTVSGLAAAIKLMKHWYVEGQRNLQLQKENVESQLQVLKAQVHPHFLFNTLNNIYSYTQNTCPVASKLLMGLSDILRYMLYECNQPLVPLTKELKMVEEYIQLEKIRYGNKLEIHVNVPDTAESFYIAPLLLLPFIENCFKHGLSNILEHPWMNLDVSIEKNTMIMKLLNGKSAADRALSTSGIGIANVRRRLELVYPNKHELIIKNEEEIFIVNLKLELEKKYALSRPVIQTANVAING